MNAVPYQTVVRMGVALTLKGLIDATASLGMDPPMMANTALTVGQAIVSLNSLLAGARLTLQNLVTLPREGVAVGWLLPGDPTVRNALNLELLSLIGCAQLVLAILQMVKT
jgi:hypothetical protein